MEFDLVEAAGIEPAQGRLRIWDRRLAVPGRAGWRWIAAMTEYRVETVEMCSGFKSKDPREVIEGVLTEAAEEGWRLVSTCMEGRSLLAGWTMYMFFERSNAASDAQGCLRSSSELHDASTTSKGSPPAVRSRSRAERRIASSAGSSRGPASGVGYGADLACRRPAVRFH